MCKVGGKGGRMGGGQRRQMEYGVPENNANSISMLPFC